MALSKIDVANMLTGATPVANGGTALTSGFVNGLTVVEEWLLTSNKTSAGDITANLAISGISGLGNINPGMSESSGVFTFPSTGIYFVLAKVEFQITTADNQCTVFIEVTQDNSSYDRVARSLSGDGTSNGVVSSGCSFALVDVTDVSNVKIKFTVDSTTLSGKAIFGASSENRTSFYFTRVGDT